MQVKLRPYQSKIIDDARSAFRGGMQSVLVQLATGGGKTVLASTMVQGSSARGLNCLWLCHRRELVSQASKAFYSLGIDHGVIAGGRSSDHENRVQIGSIQTVARRLDRLPPPDLIVFDEAHHLGAAQWQRVYDEFPRAHVVGLTATPWRLDGKGLGKWFETMVNGPTVADLIDQGSLSTYRLFAPSTPDVTSVATAMGDFKSRDLASVMDKPAITGDAVSHYRSLCPGKRAVAFAVSIEHSKHVVDQFRAAGISAAHVDGQIDHGERDRLVASFVAGETLILSNCDLLGEGFDVPAIEAAILLRPTQSLSLHLQQIGRALRPCPGKAEAIILDHAGNCMRHGLPDDDREWTLEDREKRKKRAAAEVMIRTCTKCFRVYRPAAKCPGCGHVMAGQAREVEQREGELVEVDRDMIVARRKALLRTAESFEDMKRIAAELGYRPGWAWHAWQNSRRNPANRRAA
jgi:DNA repair protein RadD